MKSATLMPQESRTIHRMGEGQSADVTACRNGQLRRRLTVEIERAAESAGSNYDESYAAWLRRIQSSVSVRRTVLFRQYLSDEDRVLDFGCGPGHLLQTLPGRQKCGVEIIPESRDEAIADGLDVRPSLDDFAGCTFDKIISSHALEHVIDPAAKLVQLREMLDPSGLLILLLPMNEWVNRMQRHWSPEDRNKHLYTWTPLLIGNLLSVCGYEPIEIRAVHQQHPRGIGRHLLRVPAAYRLAANLASFLTRKRQLLAVARPRSSDAEG